MAKTKADRIMEMAANVALSEIGAGPEITGFSDRDEARASLAALVDEAANAPADPALLALAKLGAMVYAGLCVPEFSGDESAADGRDVMDVLQEFRQSSGVGPFLPGIADAIAALLAPDGAASEGVPG